MSAPLKILVVRRDNIGDLVCTTPLIAALRRRFPEAWLGALVNSYNAPVLHANPDLDATFAYRKIKHRDAGESLAANLLSRLGLVAQLRRKALDYVLLAGNASRSPGIARLAGARRSVGFAAGGPRPDIVVDPGEARHEVEIVFRLARAFDIDGPPPAPAVYPDPGAVARVRAQVTARLPQATRLVGVHISARKPSQRWPAERFAQLLRQIAQWPGAGVLLFWSPGAEADPRHPGDDEKAARLVRELDGLPLVALATPGLDTLIAGLSLCDRLICSDGGAMHLAAAMGKPIVCMFGQSDAQRWRPWGVRHVLLQPESRNVADIPVAEVLEACAALR